MYNIVQTDRSAYEFPLGHRIARVAVTFPLAFLFVPLTLAGYVGLASGKNTNQLRQG